MRNDEVAARSGRVGLILLVGVVLALGPAAPARAHGVSDTADLHLAQTFAGNELTLVLRRTPDVPGPLQVRDYAIGVPLIPITLPFGYPVAALVVAGGMLRTRRHGISPRGAMPALGGVAAGIVALGYLAVPSVGFTTATALVAVPVGALCSWLGWQLGSAARQATGRETDPVTSARLTTVEA